MGLRSMTCVILLVIPVKLSFSLRLFRLSHDAPPLCIGSKHLQHKWDFPKIRVPYFGVLIIRIPLF